VNDRVHKLGPFTAEKVTVVVAGGPRLGDLRAGAMAATTGLGMAWSGSAFVCLVLVLATAVLVRPFWRYDAGSK
jgi:hypothetical protein